MSTEIKNANSASALFSKTRQLVLSLFFNQPDEAFYLRQIVRATGTGTGAVQRELKQLTQAGIIQRTVHGRRVFYQANPDCPVFAEIKSLASKIYSSVRSGDKKNVNIPEGKIARFCRRHHIRRLSLFGSVLRDDFSPDSDIDILVEFEPGYVPGFFGLFDMEAELSSLLGGRKVDMRTSGDLSHYFRTQVVKEARTVYAKAR